MKNISEDRHSALPLYEVKATEGDSIDLNIFFLQNGPSSRDYYTFTITTGGSAISKAECLLFYVVIIILLL